MCCFIAYIRFYEEKLSGDKRNNFIDKLYLSLHFNFYWFMIRSHLLFYSWVLAVLCSTYMERKIQSIKKIMGLLGVLKYLLIFPAFLIAVYNLYIKKDRSMGVLEELFLRTFIFCCIVIVVAVLIVLLFTGAAGTILYFLYNFCHGILDYITS